jgi:hypothetical protein
MQIAIVARFVSPPGEIRWRASSFARRPWLTIALHLPCDGRLRAESANLPGSRAKPIGAEMIALSVTIPSAFEEIDWMVRNIEHAALIVAGLLALACVACEWRA